MTVIFETNQPKHLLSHRLIGPKIAINDIYENGEFMVKLIILLTIVLTTSCGEENKEVLASDTLNSALKENLSLVDITCDGETSPVVASYGLGTSFKNELSLTETSGKRVFTAGECTISTNLEIERLDNILRITERNFQCNDEQKCSQFPVCSLESLPTIDFPFTMNEEYMFLTMPIESFGNSGAPCAPEEVIRYTFKKN